MCPVCDVFDPKWYVWKSKCTVCFNHNRIHRVRWLELILRTAAMSERSQTLSAECWRIALLLLETCPAHMDMSDYILVNLRHNGSAVEAVIESMHPHGGQASSVSIEGTFLCRRRLLIDQSQPRSNIVTNEYQASTAHRILHSSAGPACFQSNVSNKQVLLQIGPRPQKHILLCIPQQEPPTLGAIMKKMKRPFDNSLQ